MKGVSQTTSHFDQIETAERQIILDRRQQVNYVLTHMENRNSDFVADFVTARSGSTPEHRGFIMGGTILGPPNSSRS